MKTLSIAGVVMQMRIVCILVVLSTVASAVHAGDWPGFLGPLRNGTSQEPLKIAQWEKAGPKVQWRAKVGKGFAGPIVVNNVVYQAHRLGEEDILSAYEAGTGKLKWEAKTSALGLAGPQSTPLFQDDIVVSLSYGGKLWAVDTTTGKVLWAKNLRKLFSPPEGYFGAGAGLIAHDGKVLLNVGGRGASVVAFDLRSGEVAWKVGDDPPSYASPVLRANGKVTEAVFFTRTGLLVLDAQSGEVKQSYRHRANYEASVNAATPVLQGTEIFLSSCYETGAILLDTNGAKPKVLWENDTSLSSHFNTPVKLGDALFGCHGRQDRSSVDLACVEWQTGKRLWTQKKFGVAHLIAVNTTLLAWTERGELVQFEANDKEYRELQRATLLEGLTRAPPALSNGVLYVHNEAELIAVALK